MDKKRLAIIGGFAILCLALGYLLYRVFFAPKAPTQAPPGGTTGTTGQQGQFPQTGAGTPTPGTPGAAGLPQAGNIPPTPRPSAPAQTPEVAQLVSDPIVSPASDASGNAEYYNQIDGKLYRIGPDGKPILLSNQVFYNVNNVTWSPRRSEAILEYPDGSNILYNFQTGKQVTLPKHWEAFSFAPQGGEIAAKSIGFSPENRWLVAAKPDGSDVALVNELGNNADKVRVDWSPNNQIVATALTGDPLGADRQEVIFIGLHGENFKSTIVEGRDIRSRWSPDGKQLLYSVYSGANDFKPLLWIVNAEGESIGTGRRLLNVETWADKCAFGDPRFVYCGVPTTLDTGAGFAPQTADATPDTLVKIDTQSGQRTEIRMQDAHTVNTIFTSPDGKKLFFTDKTKSGLFSVNL